MVIRDLGCSPQAGLVTNQAGFLSFHRVWYGGHGRWFNADGLVALTPCMVGGHSWCVSNPGLMTGQAVIPPFKGMGNGWLGGGYGHEEEGAQSQQQHDA
jgi:hypothetical protein